MHESPAPLPRNGDVIVTRESHSEVRYTVRQVPGGIQFYACDREEATRLARGFARKSAVDLWYSDDGTDTLLEACRRHAS